MSNSVTPQRGADLQSSSFTANLSKFVYDKTPQQAGSTNTMPNTRRSTVPAPSNAESSESASEALKEVVKLSTPESEEGIYKFFKRKRGASGDIDAAVKKARTKKSGSTVGATSVPLVNNLKDTVRPGLILISVGVNPGKKTGEVGLPYSHQSNKYWPGLFQSGITPVRHRPEDAESLMDLYGLGHTNIVPDVATEGESGLTTQQFLDGAAVLDKKIRSLKPEAVMLLGRGIWYKWMQYKTGKRWDPKKEGPLVLGLQSEKYWIGRKVVGGKVEYEGARTFVLESPSGQAAISTEQRISNWKVVGDWFTPKREQWMKERASGAKEA